MRKRLHIDLKVQTTRKISQASIAWLHNQEHDHHDQGTGEEYPMACLLIIGVLIPLTCYLVLEDWLTVKVLGWCLTIYRHWIENIFLSHALCGCLAYGHFTIDPKDPTKVKSTFLTPSDAV